MSAIQSALDRLATLEAIVSTKMDRDECNGLIDAKLQTAQSLNGNRWDAGKPILESKAMQDIGKIGDAKHYGAWSKKMKNAMEQSRVKARAVLEIVEKLTEE